MKTLIVYYTRTGTTAKAAEALKEKLGADIYQVKCDKYGLGPMGYAQAGKDVVTKKTCEIEESDVRLSDYDMVIIGTPIWMWNVSPPIRTFCRQNKGRLSRTAFFCTMGGSGHERAFKSMQDEVGVEPLATLALLTKEVVKENYKEKLEEFVNKLNLPE